MAMESMYEFDFLASCFLKEFLRARAMSPALKVWLWIMSGFSFATNASNSLKALWSAIGLIALPKWLMRCNFTDATDGSSASAPWTNPVAIADSMPDWFRPASNIVKYLAVPPTFIRAMRCRTFI